MKIKFKDKIQSFLPHTHKILDKFPEPYRSKLIILGYMLGIFKTVGYVLMEEFGPDGKPTGLRVQTANIIPDVGVTQIRDILSGTSTNLPANMEFGTSTDAPEASDIDLGDPLPIHNRLRAVVTTPGLFELRLKVFITNVYGPRRPYTINEIGIFADPQETGTMIAHALIVPGVSITGLNTYKAVYGLLLR